MMANRELLSISLAACGIGIGYIVYQNWKSKQEGTLLDSPQVDRSDAEPATNQAQNATTNQAQNATTNQAQNATTNQAQNAVTSTGSDTSSLNNQIQQHNHSLGEDPNSDVETDGDIGSIQSHPVITPDLVEDSGQEPQPQADSNEATSPQEASAMSFSACHHSTRDMKRKCISHLGPHDGLILCAEEDYGNANLFKQEVQEKVNVADVDVLLFEEYALPGQSHFTAIANVFDNCRYLFIFVTRNFTQANLERFQQQMALMDSIEDPEKNTRIIPVWAADKAEKLLPELSILCGINYSGGYGSLDGNKITNLIKCGRRQFLLA